MSNTPTDAEIDEVTLDVLGYAALDKETNDTARMIARAVLDKWGQPAHSGEPVAWLNPWRADQVTTDYDAYGERGIPLYTAPQPAPAPLSEMPYEKRKAIQEGEQIGASDAWFKARHEMLDTVDRRNVFRAGFDRGWSAALAAQGGD